MSNQGDHVILLIEKELERVPSSTPLNPRIFKVVDRLRQINEKAYDPEILAIGPIHHGEDHVKDMEQQKVKYLHKLLQEREELTVEKFLVELRAIEEQARQWYTESIQLNTDEFVKMLLLDGLFIIELLRNYSIRDADDDIFQSNHVLGQLKHDILLLENQLPLFVLKKLFDMTKTEHPDDKLHNLVSCFANDVFPWCPPDASSPIDDAVHLLELMYRTCFPTASRDNTHNDQEGDLDEGDNSDAIYPARELKETGIEFKKVEISVGNLFNLNFANGFIELPNLIISDKTESILLNLIAYEQFVSGEGSKHVTDYAFFMHCLVNSAKDVEILRQSGTIVNLTGDDESVYLMIKRLGRNVPKSSDFCYSKIFAKVNRHSRKPHKTWMANLRHKYFNGPWDYIKFFAALYLLMLTSGQMVFAVLSYRKRNK